MMYSPLIVPEEFKRIANAHIHNLCVTNAKKQVVKAGYSSIFHTKFQSSAYTPVTGT